MPLAASRRTRDSVGSGGSRMRTGPIVGVPAVAGSVTTGLDGEVLRGARDLEKPKDLRPDTS